MKKKITSSVLAAALALALTVPAFCAEDAAEDTAVFTQAGEEKKEPAAIGKKEEGDYEVDIKNATGKGIKEFVVEIDGEGKGDNLLEKDDVFAADEERILYFTPKEADPSKEGYKPPVYDIELTFEDDTKALLHTFPFGDVEKAEIRLEDGVGYLVFESLSLKAEQNTLEHEKNLAAAAATTDAAADAGSEGSYDTAAASDQSSAYVEESGSDDYSYDYDYDYDYGNSDYDTGYYEEQSGSDDSGSTDGGDGSGDDGCLDDGLILN
ncbi:MAG: hypothetical protein IKE03_09740 [Blautia sp.]|nr:hypothetical protein [Blautia sp.]